jgi:predicted signal transduction protein with EAL and GGDEF domain
VLLERADAALYRAKANGRNCIELADIGAPVELVARLRDDAPRTVEIAA